MRTSPTDRSPTREKMEEVEMIEEASRMMAMCRAMVIRDMMTRDTIETKMRGMVEEVRATVEVVKMVVRDNIKRRGTIHVTISSPNSAGSSRDSSNLMREKVKKLIE